MLTEEKHTKCVEDISKKNKSYDNLCVGLVLQDSNSSNGHSGYCDAKAVIISVLDWFCRTETDTQDFVMKKL